MTEIRDHFPAPFGKHPELRAGIVPRWAIIKTSKTQSVAEHSYNVAMITRIILTGFILTPLDDNDIILMALDHDWKSEVYTGDIPNPAKVRNPNAEVLSIEEAIIKLADCIEGYAFINRNCSDSTSVKMWVMGDLEVQINALCNFLEINGRDIWPTISGMVL